MTTQHITTLANALENMLNKAAIRTGDTLKLVLDAPITPAQSEELMRYLCDFRAFPTIARSGAGLTLSFDLATL